MGDFEVRCDDCNTVLHTEEDENWEMAVQAATQFGDMIACDKCKHVGISAYFGNREQNLWNKIHWDTVAAS